MTAVLQRVKECSVNIDGQNVAEQGIGLLVLLGVEDSDKDIDSALLLKFADKIAGLRIFEDEEGKMNLSVSDIGADVTVVSNFTLLANCKKGKRPSFIAAARPEVAEPLYEKVTQLIEEKLGKKVGRGVFGADMKISLLNDGPVTIIIKSDEL